VKSEGIAHIIYALSMERRDEPMTPARLARFESAMRVVLESNAAFNRHDVPGMMACMSEDCVFEITAPAPDGSRYMGKEAVTRYWVDFFLASPQARIEIEEIFGFGEHCVMRWKYSWVEMSWNKGYIRGVDIYKVRGGLIVEKLSYVKG